MKLSRNKIRKIRKQQHQSVRKWKKQHKSSAARRTTFRQSRRQNMTGIMRKYPSKLNSVINRTLKKYIPRSELMELKDIYRKLRRKNRKQKHYNMTGGGGTDVANSEIPDNLPAQQLKPVAGNSDNDNSNRPLQSEQLINTVVTSAVLAAVKAINDAKTEENTKQNPTNNENSNVKVTQGESADNKAATATATAATTATATDNKATTDTVGSEATESAPPTTETTDTTAANEESSNATTSVDANKKKQPFVIGPQVKGDISIGIEVHECKNKNEVWKLVQFLIQKGLPYYVQFELKSGDKLLNKNDTTIFDLRRILYGKFAQNIKKIPEDKRRLYIEAKDIVGIANGDTFGVEQPGQFIYTGEKGQVLKESTDSSIQVRILQEDKNATPSILTDSKRLYKIKGKDTDVKPASIDTMKFLQKLDSKNKIDTTEFRLQIAPMTPEELNKDVESIAAGNDDPEIKVVVDESNTYVVNLDVGCKITSVQTLKKSLEKARASLENEKDKSKMSAMEIFKRLSALLQNPEFAKNEGYDDFKESVYGFSYKIRGSERKYGFAQLQTFFDDKKDNLPPALIKEFLKLLNLLGHGPAGANGDCLRFDGTSQSVYELSRIKTFEKDGKIVTMKTETLDNASNMGGFMKQFSKLGQGATENKESPDATTAKDATAKDATAKDATAKDATATAKDATATATAKDARESASETQGSSSKNTAVDSAGAIATAIIMSLLKS
jgi:hypothetical protein